MDSSFLSVFRAVASSQFRFEVGVLCALVRTWCTEDLMSVDAEEILALDSPSSTPVLMSRMDSHLGAIEKFKPRVRSVAVTTVRKVDNLFGVDVVTLHAIVRMGVVSCTCGSIRLLV